MSGNSSADGPQDSQIVVPGDNLGQSGRFEAGHGVLVKNNTLLATKNGKLICLEFLFDFLFILDILNE